MNNYNKFTNSNVNIWTCHHMPFENEYENVNDMNIINYLTTNNDENSYNSIQYFINEITCVTYPYINNIKSNYIGFQHYRRKFDLDIYKNFQNISKEKADLILCKYFAWFPNGSFIIRQIYDWNITKYMITDLILFLNKYNINIYKIINSTNNFPRCNIFFTTWEVYEKIAQFDIDYINFISDKYNLSKNPEKWKQHINDIYIEPNKGKKFNAPDYNNCYINQNDHLSYRIYGFILELLNEIYLLHIGNVKFV